MTDRLTKALQYAQEHQIDLINTIKTFIRIPSISTDPASKPDIERAAQWVAGELRSLGMSNVAIYPTDNHPVVYCEALGAGTGRPTILIYGHYDVQPAEPLDLWHSPAFEPEQRGDYLYGRGTSDMKGQIIACFQALKALRETGGLPLNVKIIIEGEEEIGSPHLAAFISKHKDLLACDYAVNPDTGMLAAGMPTITYGLRGMAYFELWISGPDHDLHSGLYGGLVHNPAQVMCELIAGMHDPQGRVTLPGFYDRIPPLAGEERAELSRLPVSDKDLLDQTGAPQLHGEVGYTNIERVGARPTLEVNGLLSGFTGEGQKTIIPAKAMAKISTRLVPHQDPKEVYQQLRRYLEANAPKTIHWELTQIIGSPASIIDRHIPPVAALSQAMQDTWGKRPVFQRDGGSVPVVGHMQRILGVESVLTGFGLPEDNIHAPDERVHLPTLLLGTEALIRFMVLLGQQS